jgi:hypothetical protein
MPTWTKVRLPIPSFEASSGSGRTCMVKKLCAVQRRILSRCNSYPATVAPTGSNRSNGGGNEIPEAFDATDRSRSSEQAGRNVSEHRAGLETPNRNSRPCSFSGKAAVVWGSSDRCTQRSCRGCGVGMSAQGNRRNMGSPEGESA